MLGKDIQTKAMLLHCNTRSGMVDLTVHDVLSLPTSNDDASTSPGFTLGAGRVLGMEEKEEITTILRNEHKQGLTLLDDTILARTPYALAWWMPAREHELLFRSKEGVERVRVTLPTTIGVYCRGRLAFASIKGFKRQRPQNDTPLYLTPLPNIYSDGHFCTGNVKVAVGASEDNIPEWERFLVDSVHTHLGKKPLKGDKANKIDTMEELVALYREFEGTGKFPTKRMVPMGLTLGEWLQEIDKGGR